MPEGTTMPSEGKLREMYRTMVLIRRFEERVNELYLQGRIPSTLHLYIGQEAVATGVCANLTHLDHALSTHRPHGHALAKGVTPRALMAELMGKATGCCKAKGGSMHVGDMSVGMVPAVAIVGGSIPIASGFGLAAKMQKSGAVAVAFFGDGATNEGAFHEGMNLAAVWDLPVLFVCENNLYAASTPFRTAFKIENVVDRAAAYGMPGRIVDGNDVLAVYETAREAVERARAGNGPTLIECKTYRLCGHSRSDPRTYRSKDEEAEWQTRDPIPRFRARLIADGSAGGAELDEIEAEVERTIDEAIAFGDASPSPDPSELYTDVFVESLPGKKE
jgi:pyruvate dehydrogenase E1 component alpha subunit